VLTHLLKALVVGYRYSLKAVLPPSCRFLPSCSEYALDALALHGAGKGTWLTLRRICRCHPWGGMGYDPVPPVAAPTLTCRRVGP
jgi:hypothetical protein